MAAKRASWKDASYALGFVFVLRLCWLWRRLLLMNVTRLGLAGFFCLLSVCWC